MSPGAGPSARGSRGVTQVPQPCREIPVKQVSGGVLARLRPDPEYRRRPGLAGWATYGVAAARELGSLSREDHRDTLGSACTLAAELAEMGEYQAAKQLDEDTLDRRRHVLGDGHLDTRISANFALILSGHVRTLKHGRPWKHDEGCLAAASRGTAARRLT